MEFKENKGIYQQIGDQLCEQILTEQLQVGQKIPSVREHAATIGVNQNTIMRTYTELQRAGIIENKRGIGYFVAKDATLIIQKTRKTVFFQNTLPEVIKQIKLLDISKVELKSLFETLD